MLLAAISFLSGVVLLHNFAEFGSRDWPLWSLAAGGAAVLLQGRTPGIEARWREMLRLGLLLLCGLMLGLGWAGWQAQHYLDHRLPESLAGQDLLLSGTVVSLVEHSGERRVSRFVFMLDPPSQQAEPPPGTSPFPQKLRLSWYYGKAVAPGERWQFRLRLKPPHGFLNPGGFDYESWLYQQGIHATGYVRKDAANRKLSPWPWWQQPAVAAQAQLNSVRQRIQQQIGSALPQAELAGVIEALAIGSRKHIGQAHWQTFLDTGTNHLMAISGLHIGLAAAFGFAIALFAAKRLLPHRWLLYVPAQHVATVGALFAALAYALISGLGIPTQRALVMLASVSLFYLLRRHVRPLDALALALLLVLIIQPASVLAPGFWFSFLAVAVIMLAYQHGLGQKSWWQQLLWLQLILSLCLLPVSLQWFMKVSLVAPLANLVMVPLVSFVVVPLVLAAVVLLPLSSTLAAWMWQLAHAVLQAVWPALQWLGDADIAYGTLTAPAPLLWLVLGALLGLLFPGWIRNLLGSLTGSRLPAWPDSTIRLLSAPLLALLLIDFRQPVAAGDFTLDILDVGQGTAVVVRTRQHTLVYDSGPRLGERLDAGAAVVVPYLRHLGVRNLDRLVISHGDSDHIGGAASVLQAYPRAEVIGQQLEKLSAAIGRPCIAGEHWQWDGVQFTFLHPPSAPPYKKSNNLSCVLKISAGGGSVLLSGDIEKKVERELLRRQAPLAADILLVAHHGSKSSTTVDWLRAVAPHYAVITAGYRNRYRLPARRITQRLRHHAGQVLISGLSGAIRFHVDAGDGISPPRLYRQQYRRFWHHRLSNPAEQPGIRPEIRLWSHR